MYVSLPLSQSAIYGLCASLQGSLSRFGGLKHLATSEQVPTRRWPPCIQLHAGSREFRALRALLGTVRCPGEDVHGLPKWLHRGLNVLIIGAIRMWG